MRCRIGCLVITGVATVVALSGCADAAPGSPSESPSTSSSPSNAALDEPSADTDSPQIEPVEAAADAGGACVFLDFATLTEATGVAFTLAVGRQADEANGCLLQTTAGSYPDLTLTQAPTDSDADTYRDRIEPDDASEVDDLGDAAYRAVRDEVPGGGHVAEVGWLSDGHLYTLRYTAAAGTDKDEVNDAAKALVDVAQHVDAAASGDG